MKISDFQTKDVINIVDGKKLGQLSDLGARSQQGRIESIVIPAAGDFSGLFGSGEDLVIPWRSIVKIGMDVVLVKMDGPENCSGNITGEAADSPADYHRYIQQDMR